MRAELSISHKQGDIAALLVSLYGAHDPGALLDSAFAHKTPGAASAVTYAARTPGLIVMAWFVGTGVELYVEAGPGRSLRREAVGVWSAIRDDPQGNALKLKLKRLALVDEDAPEEIVTARPGVGGWLGGRLKLGPNDLYAPIATGIVTGVVLLVVAIVSQASSDFFYGSATALGVAAVSLALLFWPSKELVWR